MFIKQKDQPKETHNPKGGDFCRCRGTRVDVKVRMLHGSLTCQVFGRLSWDVPLEVRIEGYSVDYNPNTSRL